MEDLQIILQVSLKDFDSFYLCEQYNIYLLCVKVIDFFISFVGSFSCLIREFACAGNLVQLYADYFFGFVGPV